MKRKVRGSTTNSNCKLYYKFIWEIIIIKGETLIRYRGITKRKVGGSTIGKWKCQPSGAHARLWVDTGNRATRACPVLPSYSATTCYWHSWCFHVFWTTFYSYLLYQFIHPFAVYLLLCFTVCYCATATGGRQAGVWPPFLSRGQCVILLRPGC